MAKVSLGRKQEVFTYYLAKMIVHMVERENYQCRLKEVLRTEEQSRWYAAQGKGIINSNHRNGCAADMYFTQEGELFWSGEPYGLAADYWSSLSDDKVKFCWGGDFRRRDVYHYSIKHNGVM